MMPLVKEMNPVRAMYEPIVHCRMVEVWENGADGAGAGAREHLAGGVQMAGFVCQVSKRIEK